MADKNESAAPSLSPRLFASTALGLTLACAEGIDRAFGQTVGGYSTPLPTISVPGSAPQRSPDYKVDQPSLPKLTEPLADTPQSITVVPRQVIEDRAATTFRDAVRNVTGISLAAGEGGHRATTSPSAASPHAPTSSSTGCATSAATTAIPSSTSRSTC